MCSPLVIRADGHPDNPEQSIIGWIGIDSEVIPPAVERVVIAGTCGERGWSTNGTCRVRRDTPGNHHRTSICGTQVTERYSDIARAIASNDPVCVVPRRIGDIARLRHCGVGPGCWPAVCGDVIPAHGDTAVDTDGMGCEQLATPPGGAVKATIPAINRLPTRTRGRRRRIHPCGYGLKPRDHCWCGGDVPNGHHFMIIVVKRADSVEHGCRFAQHFGVLDRDDLVVLKCGGVCGTA